MFNNYFFQNRAILAIMWKDTDEADRSQLTMWRMSIACWIAKATSTHAEYVIIIGFSTSTIVTRTRLDHIRCGYITSRQFQHMLRSIESL
jgi:hypothetical protein